MAAIPIEIAVVAAVAAGSVVIPAAATGIAAAVARAKMKPQKVNISDVLALRRGDHISYKVGKLTHQHAIVAEIISRTTANLIFVTGKGGHARVNSEDTDLSGYFDSLQLLEYNSLICFPKEDVLRRAKSLSEIHNNPDRHSVINSYWAFFKDDEHFAMWCQTGLEFVAVCRGMASTDYKRTEVRSINSIREGDHVCYKVGAITYEHAIVETIITDSNTLGVVWFGGRSNQTPVMEDIDVNPFIQKGQLYRYDYDIGVGDDGDVVVDRAINEVGKMQENVRYGGNESFAIWCKTQSDSSLSDLSTLAKARVISHVCTLVQAKGMLKIGDHISYNSGAVYYYQHAIVVAVNDTCLDVIYLPGNEKSEQSLSIMQATVDVAQYINKGQLLKFFYDVHEWDDVSAVIARAQQHRDSSVSKTHFKDPQHFAFWCKTGIYQVHGKVPDDEF